MKPPIWPKSANRGSRPLRPQNGQRAQNVTFRGVPDPPQKWHFWPPGPLSKAYQRPINPIESPILPARGRASPQIWAHFRVSGRKGTIWAPDPANPIFGHFWLFLAFLAFLADWSPRDRITRIPGRANRTAKAHSAISFL